jgi:hypothetical protein
MLSVKKKTSITLTYGHPKATIASSSPSLFLKSGEKCNPCTEAHVLQFNRFVRLPGIDWL